MGKATGVFLILAGVGTAALVLPAVDKDAERQLADVVRIATGATQTSAQTGATQPAPAETAPAKIQLRPTAVPSAQTATVAAPPIVPTAQAAESKPAAIATGSIAAAVGTGAAPVLIAPPQQAPTKNATATPAKPVDTQARQILARDIQRELKRVGCYDGEVSGEWSPVTRKSMKAFIDRVNAALPIDEPDHILRTMVQGHPGNACGKACSSGQTMNADGRCLPAAIVAQQTAPKPVRNAETAQREAVAVPKDIAALSSAAAPSQWERSTSRPTPPKPTWETTVATAPAVPFPGEQRMAIGGPAPVASNGPVNIGPRTAVAKASREATTEPPQPSARSGNVPGAIAALATGSTPTASAQPPPAQPGSGNSGENLADKADAQKEQQRREAAAQQRARDRERQAAAVVRRPPPEAFRYPAPSFVGAVPRYITNVQKPERSTFNVKIYDKFVRDMR